MINITHAIKTPDSASEISNIPAGNIAATTVQTAINELDTEKQPASANLDEYAAVNPTAAGLALLDDATASDQRTTLGLGTAAVKNTGTSGDAVPLLNAANTWSLAQTLSANPLVNGGGVQFPATQVPSADANCLDDYEEGTFTPAFSASGATFSYSFQNGSYTKIGRQVFFSVDIGLNTSGNTLTANPLSITGLPFTASASSGAGIFLVRWSASTTSYVGVYVRVPGGTSTLVVEGITAAATTSGTPLNSNAILHATNGSALFITCSYFV